MRFSKVQSRPSGLPSLVLSGDPPGPHLHAARLLTARDPDVECSTTSPASHFHASTLPTAGDPDAELSATPPAPRLHAATLLAMMTAG